MTVANLEIRKLNRSTWGIQAGAHLVARTFRTHVAATRWAEDNADFLARLANS